MFAIFNIIKMQAQFICYKLKFVNLESRYKFTEANPTQPDAKYFKLYYVEGNHGFYWVRIFTSRTCGISLKK